MAERTPAARRRRRRRLRGRAAATAGAAAAAVLTLMVLPEMMESVEAAAEAHFSSIPLDKDGGPYHSAEGAPSSSAAAVRRIGRLRRRLPVYETIDGLERGGGAEGFNEGDDDEAGRRDEHDEDRISRRRLRRLLGEGGQERHRRHGGGPPSRDAANEGDDDGVKVLASPEAPPAAVAVSFDAAEASNQAASATQLPPAGAESEEEGRGRSWDPVGVPFSFAIASSDDSGAADGEGDNNDLVPLSSEAIADLRSALDALVTDLFAEEEWEIGSGEEVGDGDSAPSRRRRRLRRQQGEPGDASAAAVGAILDQKAAASAEAATAPLTRATARRTRERSATVLDVRYDGEAVPPSVDGTSSIACSETVADDADLRCYLIDATVTVLVSSSSPSFEFGSRPLPSSEESSLGSNLRSLVQETVAAALNDAVEEGQLDEALAFVNPDGPIRGTWPAYRESARVFGGGGDDVGAAGAELYGGGVPERQAEEEDGEVHASSDEGEGASSAARAEALDNAADVDANNATDADAADDTGEATAKDSPAPPKGRKISDFAIVAIALGSTAALATILDCHQHIMKYFGIDVRGEGGDRENVSKSDDGDEDESGTDPLENGGGGGRAGAGERHLEDGRDGRRGDAEKACAPPVKDGDPQPPPSAIVRGNRSDDEADDDDDDDDIEMDCSSSLSGLGDVYDLSAEHKKKEGRGGERERGPGCPPGESSSTMLMSMSLANLTSGLHSGFNGGGGAGGGGNGGEGTNNGGTSSSLFEHGSDSGGSAMMRIVEGGE